MTATIITNNKSNQSILETLEGLVDKKIGNPKGYKTYKLKTIMHYHDEFVIELPIKELYKYAMNMHLQGYNISAI